MSSKRRAARMPSGDIDDFIEAEKNRGLSHDTLDVYRTQLEVFCHDLHKNSGVTVRDATTDDIMEHIVRFRKRGTKRLTIVQRIHTYNSFYTFMADTNRVTENPIDQISLDTIPEDPSRDSETKGTALSRKDVTQLLRKLRVPHCV